MGEKLTNRDGAGSGDLAKKFDGPNSDDFLILEENSKVELNPNKSEMRNREIPDNKTEPTKCPVPPTKLVPKAVRDASVNPGLELNGIVAFTISETIRIERRKVAVLR
jgi:hypothetical protein